MIFFLILFALVGVILYLIYTAPSPLIFVLMPYLVAMAMIGYYIEQNKLGYGIDDVTQLNGEFVVNSFLVDDNSKCIYYTMQAIYSDMTLGEPRLYKVCRDYEQMRQVLEKNADKMKSGQRFGAKFKGTNRKIDGDFHDFSLEMYQINTIQKAFPKEENDGH